jgi:hypothetical protein
MPAGFRFAFRSVLVVSVCGMALATAAQPARADDPLLERPAAPPAHAVVAATPPGTCCRPRAVLDPCWSCATRFTVMVGAWTWGVQGRLGSDGRAVEVDADWTDAFDVLHKIESSLNAGVRVERGRWSLGARVDGADLEDTTEYNEVGSGPIGGRSSAWFVQAQLGYGFARGSFGGCGTWCAEAVVGVRACWTSLELDQGVGAAPAPAVDADLEWIDPLVGARVDFHLGRKWFAVLEADVGGFGVGSDFAWNVVGSIGYEFNCHVFVALGWRTLDIDYRDGTDVFDAQLSGPFLHLGVTW